MGPDLAPDLALHISAGDGRRSAPTLVPNFGGGASRGWGRLRREDGVDGNRRQENHRDLRRSPVPDVTDGQGDCEGGGGDEDQQGVDGARADAAR